MKRLLKRLISEVPFIKRLQRFQTYWLPGHYYSPITNTNEALETIQKKTEEFSRINGIELNDTGQLALIDVLIPYMKQSVFRNEEKISTHRFINKNGVYEYSDALILESMIRHLKPVRIIEAGSGYSSALMLDVNEKYFNNSILLSFIEPYPRRLLSLLSNEDKNRIALYDRGLQTIDLSVFKSLQSNDILFIDSSHVVKAGSDMMYLFFEILPALNKGVYVHFHDIFNNFEYLPLHFKLYKGFGWNECYFLRAFLMYNPQFEIVLFSNYLETKYREYILNLMPDFPLSHGAQIWIKKV